MARKNKWVYVGRTQAHGYEYKKGNACLIIYSNGAKRYWREFPGKLTVYRAKQGRETWWENI